MQVKRILGIDPGITGASVLLDLDGGVVEFGNFPLIGIQKPGRKTVKNPNPKPRLDNQYNLREIAHKYTFIADGTTVAYLELVSSRPGGGVASMFKFGKCTGQLEGCLVTAGIPFLNVHPKSWCRELHIPGDKEPKAKKRSKNAFNQIFGHQFRGEKGINDGIIDACLIAEYGRRRVVAGMDLWKVW